MRNLGQTKSDLGGSEIRGKIVTVHRQLPTTVDRIVDTVREILLLGEIQTISLRVGYPIMYQRFVGEGEELHPSETTIGFSSLSLLDVVRMNKMEEYVSTFKTSLPEVLVRMFTQMSMERLSVTHILLSNNTLFWPALHIDSYVSKHIQSYMGASVEYDSTLPKEVFLLCGSKTKYGALSEVCFSLKGMIEIDESVPKTL